MTQPILGVPAPRRPDGLPNVLLAGLTPEQAAAVRHGRGPLLGAGRSWHRQTRTLIHRVAYLVAVGHALLGERRARGVRAAPLRQAAFRAVILVVIHPV